jgi:Na+/H+ antiporter NhaD/arsenite permease-like protein
VFRYILGSTLTIFGNPQMALMASKSNAFVDPNSRLELKTCVEYLWLPVFIVWLLNFFFLLLHHRLSRNSSKETPLEEAPSEISAVEQQQQSPAVIETSTITKLPRFTERYRLRQLRETYEPTPSMLTRTTPIMISRSVSIPSFAGLDEEMDEEEGEEGFEASESRFFKIILFILLIIVIALLFASNEKTYFDIGM